MTEGHKIGDRRLFCGLDAKRQEVYFDNLLSEKWHAVRD